MNEFEAFVGVSDEDRTVEVLDVPEAIEEELLSLYFSNKRRSGGGQIASLERNSNRAVLVFEEVDVAKRVLSLGTHTLNNATLTVRRPPAKDPGKLLLRGLNPHTSLELVELYVENMMGVDQDEYTLYPTPGNRGVIVHFHKPFSKDLQTLCERISRKALDGAQVLVERVDRTDAVLVQNLCPPITEDMLSLYFQSRRCGGGPVREVCMLGGGAARVSFDDFKAVDLVLGKAHWLEETDLTVRPYLPALLTQDDLPTLPHNREGPDSTDGSADRQRVTQGSSFPAVGELTSPSSGRPNTSGTEPDRGGAPLGKWPGVTEAGVGSESRLEGGVKAEAARSAPPAEVPLLHIPVQDPVKLRLLQMSTLEQDIVQANPNFDLRFQDDGVRISGPDRLRLEKLKVTVLEYLGSIASERLTLDPEKAQFLALPEVKEEVMGLLEDRGFPSAYSVSGQVLEMTSLSASMAGQACQVARSLAGAFTVPVERRYECMLYSQEWPAFLRSLGACSATPSPAGDLLHGLALRGMEEEKRRRVVEFLSTPVQVESVIAMEPGMLKYIQTHCHQLLADMDQVSIFPLEGEVTGLRIQGDASAGQIADEVLRGVVSSVCTRTITVTRPGVARFLVQGEGSGLLAEMMRRFQVYISLEQVHWKPLEEEDVFDAAWKTMPPKYFQRNTNSHNSTRPSAPTLKRSVSGPDPLGGVDRGKNTLSMTGLIEEAKRLVSVIEDDQSSEPSSLERIIGLKKEELEEDLYTSMEPPSQSLTVDPAEGARTADGVEEEGAPLLEARGINTEPPQEVLHSSSDLEEEAQLSLAIQYSLDKGSMEEEEDEELRRALELSRMTARADGDEDSQLERVTQLSLQDAIRAANKATLLVYAGYSCDLIRVDIALGKKVAQGQVTERLESPSLLRLSELHHRCVDVIQRKHAVDVQIQGTTATVSGFKDYVAEAVPALQKLLSRIPSSTSGLEVRWAWLDPASSRETPYPPDVESLLEEAWRMRKIRIDVLFDGQPHVLDFKKMEELSVASGRARRISRKILSSVDVFTELPDCTLLSNLPDASIVDEDTDEFQNVVDNFLKGAHENYNKIEIVKVEKLMNCLLLNQYQLKKASIKQTAVRADAERTLFHGTSESSVKEICVHGFNRSFCGKNATMYGQGVYFAVESTLSLLDQYSPPNANGHKFVFVCKVLTGDFTTGRQEFKAAPLKEKLALPLRFDSVVDSVATPTLFVIFNDTQAYPEYLITCKKIP